MHSRAHYYRQYGGYSMQNVTYSMEHGTWRLKGLQTAGLHHKLRSLMAPGKQGPADIYTKILVRSYSGFGRFGAHGASEPEPLGSRKHVKTR